MAIIKGATASLSSKTFADGFREGYTARMSNDAAIPAIPAHSIPAGVCAYLSGFAGGIAAALREKPVREAPPD
jgi:hypothetical protein